MSTLRTNTLQDAAGGSSVPMATVAAGTAKAWVNFNGTGTVAIRQAFNVSSITDNGTGDYTVNFTSAVADANYSVSLTNSTSGGGTFTPSATTFLGGMVMTQSTTALRFGNVYGPGGNAFDAAVQCAAVFR